MAVRRIDVALLAGVQHPRVIEALVRRGADPEVVDRNGDSLLHLGASEHTVLDRVHLRLAGRISRRAVARQTPLHNAAASGNAQAIAILVAAGANIEARDEYGRTALHLACTYPPGPAIVDALLVAGASINAQDSDGSTPLHDAVRAGPVAVEVLLDGGCGSPGPRCPGPYRARASGGRARYG